MVPRWMTYARTFNGLREVPGPKSNPTIVGWLRGLRAWWLNDNEPWCASFVAHVMQHCGFALPAAWYRAKSWATWGSPCVPMVGAVCVKERVGGGHVFFAVGKSKGGFIHAYGGNQRDSVCTVMIHESEITAWRWPLREPFGDPLPDLAPIGHAGSEA